MFDNDARGVAAGGRAAVVGEPRRDEEPLGEAELNTVGYVLSRYGGLTGRDLVNLTHSEEPWRRADSARPPGTSVPIAARWMEDYFRSEMTTMPSSMPPKYRRGCGMGRTS